MDTNAILQAFWFYAGVVAVIVLTPIIGGLALIWHFRDKGAKK